MKKQILILVLFVMATFANVTAFGQAVHHNYPEPLTCDNDALHPIAGKKYNYKVNIDGAAAALGDYTWWATKNQAFITNPLGVQTTNISTALPADATNLLFRGANYGVSTAAADNVDITWSSPLLNGTTYQGNGVSPNGTPTFVVVHYESTGTDCADNLKVYEISPINGFTVDIKNIDKSKIVANALADADTLDFGDAATQCADIVRGATYNATNFGIDYDYGTNIMYFEVIASNFSGTYTPSFKIDGLEGTQEAKIEWADNLAFTGAVTVEAAAVIGDNGTGATGTAFVSPSAVTTNATNTAIGVSIYVRVTVSNKTHETITTNSITISVNGQNAELDYDVVNGTGTDDCSTTALADWVDTSIQTIDVRPDITTNTTVIPANGAPDDLINKN